jgi:hypothetical protein
MLPMTTPGDILDVKLVGLGDGVKGARGADWGEFCFLLSREAV